MKIFDAEKKNSEDTIPGFEKLVEEELGKILVEDSKSKMINSQLNDEEDEARRQYEDSVAKMKQASERIKRIKAEKEERFQMQIEEQRKEECQRKEKDDEKKRQILPKVSAQRKESIKSQKAIDLSKIIDEQIQHRQKLMELEIQVEQERQKKIKPEQKEQQDIPLSEELPQEQVKTTKKESSGMKETSRSAVTGALKLVLEDNQKTTEVLMKASKGKSMTEEEKFDQEDQRILEVELEKLEEPTEENAATICGDWMHRVNRL